MPRVTVVTPNFNHARYLPQRLDSILAQTYRDFELIILDNASTDNSREVIELYAKDPRVKAIFNPVNNGSCFKQWHLGVSQAKGDYIWFAESDDYAEPSLLETLVDRLDRYPNVGLAVCQSWAVDEDSNKLRNMSDIQNYLHHSCRWHTDYVNSGHDECMNYFFLHNTIPNASAALLRRDILACAGGVPHDMLHEGDYMTYIRVLAHSDIAFVSKPLNYFRHHIDTNRSRFAHTEVPFRERAMIQRELINRYGRPRWLRHNHEVQTRYVSNWINGERRPPHNRVPPKVALALLAGFARTRVGAFGIALRMLAWDQMAYLLSRAGLLETARRVKTAMVSKNH